MHTSYCQSRASNTCHRTSELNVQSTDMESRWVYSVLSNCLETNFMNIYSFPHGRTFQTQSQLSPTVHGGRGVHQINMENQLLPQISVYFASSNKQNECIQMCTSLHKSFTACVKKEETKENVSLPMSSFTFCFYRCWSDSTECSHYTFTGNRWQHEGQFYEANPQSGELIKMQVFIYTVCIKYQQEHNRKFNQILIWFG